ncbi:MAG: hypothetical protein SNH13_07320, partial [Rikenellaceae bacterium]
MRKIFQLLLAVVIVGLIYTIYVQISTPIRFEEEKAQKDAAVIERIKSIRLCERAFKSKYQQFTGNFDSLINFVLYDSLEMERKIYDEDDSLGMALLKKEKRQNVEKFTVAVIDTVFAPARLTPDQVKALRYVPFTEDKVEYILSAGKITTESKVVIPIVECRVPYIMYLDTVQYRQEIINLIDNDVNNFNKYPGIKFGSMEGGNNEAGGGV